MQPMAACLHDGLNRASGKSWRDDVNTSHKTLYCDAVFLCHGMSPKANIKRSVSAYGLDIAGEPRDTKKSKCHKRKLNQIAREEALLSPAWAEAEHKAKLLTICIETFSHSVHGCP